MSVWYLTSLKTLNVVSGSIPSSKKVVYPNTKSERFVKELKGAGTGPQNCEWVCHGGHGLKLAATAYPQF
jgi:hypothetical protein